MNSKVSQPQTRGFLRLIIKAFYLFVGILILGSFTTSYAQKRTIVRQTLLNCDTNTDSRALHKLCRQSIEERTQVLPSENLTAVRVDE